MRRAAIVTLLCMVSAASVSAQMKVQKPAAGPAPITVNGARVGNPQAFQRISQTDALRLYKEGKAVFIDVRSSGQYALGHIKGALSIPGSQLVRRFSEVPLQKTVITYCACSAEQSSGHAAGDLTAHGVKNVFALKGGWLDWKSNGHPTATGDK
jgi:rhodanese-related sulfurtransferase